MKRAYRGMVQVVTALGISVCFSALAQDWPQWRGPNRDGKAAGFNAPKSWPKELKQEWQTKVGSGDASPACVGDRLYVFSNEGGGEVIRCLDAKTGKELWQNKYEVPAVSGPDSGHGGPRSSPAVADGKVVTLGVNGTVSCLDAQSGKLLWRKNDFPDAWPKFHTATSPLVTGGMCITQLGKESEGAVVAYDLNTGDQKWKWADEGPGYASPVLMTLNGTPMVVTLTSKSVVGIQPSDGKLLWKFDSGLTGIARSRGVSYWSDGHESRIFAGFRSFLYAIDAKTGKSITSFGEGGKVDLRKGLRGEDYLSQSVQLTTPGAIYKDLIIVGGQNPETYPSPPGDIRAFDVR